MSTKKRFSISADLASGIRNTIQTAAVNQGQLHYDMMVLDMIEPDPANPRKLLIGKMEMLYGISTDDPHYKAKAKELEALQELAHSIEKVGIRNAIEVYKEGVKYRIISGERRYYAAILGKQKSVPVRISQKPDEFNLRYTQWIENIHRQDLSLWEKYLNLSAIVDAYQKHHQQEINEASLQKLLGVSTIQAYRYFCLMKADEKVVQLIQLGRLNNLKLVQELVVMKDKGARNQILSWLLLAKQEVTSLSQYRESIGKKTFSLKKAAQHQFINLGKLPNPLVAKQLLEIILADARFLQHRHEYTNIDWNSTKSVGKAFKTVIKTLEKSIRPQARG